MKKSKMVGHLSEWLYYNTVYSPFGDLPDNVIAFKDASQRKKDHCIVLAKIALGLCEDYSILKEWEPEDAPKKCCGGGCHGQSENDEEEQL